MYNAVGIDVSKGKSTIAVLQPGGTVIRKPFDVSHTSQSLHELTDYLGSLDGSTKIVMECTGRYHEPVVKALSEAGLFVSVVNPHRIKNFGNNSLRKVKSDPADAKKIARYTLSYSFFTNRQRIAFSTARIITPTSAKIARYIFAIPTAPNARQANFTTSAIVIF